MAHMKVPVIPIPDLPSEGFQEVASSQKIVYRRCIGIYGILGPILEPSSLGQHLRRCLEFKGYG